MQTRAPQLAGLAMLFVCVPLVGCINWRGGSDESLKNLLKPPKPPERIGQAASALNLEYRKIQSFGVINGLRGTGGIEPASKPRDIIMQELLRHDVAEPNRFLDSDSTAIVLIETVIPPGARRGDPVDLTLRTPTPATITRDQCSSLKGGWLMPARLAYTQLIGERARTSDTLVLGQGPVIVRDCFEVGEDPQLKLEGRVLGGGRVQDDYPVQLVIRPEYQHVAIAKQFAEVVNRRFHFFDGSQRRGIANPKKDDLIEIEIPDRYRHNVHRLMAVIGQMNTTADIGSRQEQLEILAKQMTEPTTAQNAALQLEGLGQEGASALLVALSSENPEIRFYAAEALAYLDHEDSVDALVELVRDHSAFRYQGLLALSTMTERRAAEGLRDLLSVSSTEARCGAFDAIIRRNDRATILQGKPIRGGSQELARYYNIPSGGEPLVAISLRRHSSIATFGGPIPIQLTEPLAADNGLVIVANQAGGLQINRITTGSESKFTAPATIEGVCQGIAKVGGNYGDIVECLRLLKEQNAYTAQLAIDVLPEPLREYNRSDQNFVDRSGLPPEPITTGAEPQERIRLVRPAELVSIVPAYNSKERRFSVDVFAAQQFNPHVMLSRLDSTTVC